MQQEREPYGEKAPPMERVKRLFWKALGWMVVAVSAVTVIMHLPQIIDWAARSLHRAGVQVANRLGWQNA